MGGGTAAGGLVERESEGGREGGGGGGMEGGRGGGEGREGGRKNEGKSMGERVKGRETEAAAKREIERERGLDVVIATAV